MSILHITNGDATVAVMRAAGVRDDILPWRDVLHDGPVPATDSLDALSQIRARFIADRGWGAYEPVLTQFRQRDALLARSTDYDEVILWFEHDLYDQLQLLQLLDWFARKRISADVNLIQANTYLGRMTPIALAGLHSSKRRVTAAQFDLAVRAWRAFTAATPRPWFNLLARDLSALPYLAHSVLRLLEEYPADGDGLSRSERGILAAVSEGETQLGSLFGRWQRYEEPLFMGDRSFYWRVESLATSPYAALKTSDGQPLRLPPSQTQTQSLALTGIGHDLLHRRCDWTALNGINKWIGGVHVNSAARWRWSPTRQRVLH